MSDYSKHWPWYAKLSRGYKWQKFFCKLGLHIPIGLTDKHTSTIKDVWCQECVKELTLADWNKFWRCKDD